MKIKKWARYLAYAKQKEIINALEIRNFSIEELFQLNHAEISGNHNIGILFLTHRGPFSYYRDKEHAENLVQETEDRELNIKPMPLFEDQKKKKNFWKGINIQESKKKMEKGERLAKTRPSSSYVY